MSRTNRNGELHASIDIGSNTLRLLIARPASHGASTQPWETVAYNHQIARLGQGLHESSLLSEAGMGRALNALLHFKSLIDQHRVKPEHVYAVATAAVREATNGREFIARVFEQTGIRITVIDGEHEATASLLGAASVLHAATRSDMLLFDIGGGSTEFVRAKNGTIIDAISCKLGVVRLVETHLRSDPPSADDYQAMKAAADVHLQTVTAYWQKQSDAIPPCMVGTAGTVTTLAAVQMNLVPYDAQRINNHQIGRAEFEKLRDSLLAMTHEQRQQIPTIEAGRADLLIAGLAIIEAIMERWGYNAFITVDAGLLEGNWLASYKNS